jgi:gamma-glutamylcyclotransferase (GGCT)/AIG2-like uncharacterized protein YtfP
MLSIFVYGTLKPGQSNYGCCCDHVSRADAAMVRGQLFDLPVGYPAMTLGDQWVLGYRLTFADEAILLILDELEDYSLHRPSHHNEYQRVWVQIFNREGQSLGEGWTYCMDANRVRRHQGRLVDSGEWQGKR